MSAGRMDRSITMQFASESTDSTTNQPIEDWNDEAVLWAEWLPISAQEVWQARQIDATIEGAYKVHYRDDVAPNTARILGHDGRLYDVRGVTEIGRREGLLISVIARGEA